MIPHYQADTTLVHEVDIQLTNRDAPLKQLKSNLQMPINRMQQLTNSKRRDVEFKEGD